MQQVSITYINIKIPNTHQSIPINTDQSYSTRCKPIMDAFPQFFQAGFTFTNMALCKENDTSYRLIPCNQLEWQFTLSKVSATQWHVQGDKMDAFDYWGINGPNTCEYTFEWKQNQWHMINVN